MDSTNGIEVQNGYLSYCPSQGQHSTADHSCDDVCSTCPPISCKAEAEVIDK